MMERLRQISESGWVALEAQFAFIRSRAVQTGLLIAALVMAGCVAGAAVCAFLLSIVWALAPAMGMTWALMFVSGVVVLAAATVGAVVYARARRAVERSEKRAAEARWRFREAITPEESKPGADKGKPGLGEQAVSIITSHPKLIASGLFAAASLVGIRRTISVLRTAAAIVSAGAVASSLKHADEQRTDEHRGNGRTERPRQATPRARERAI